jgi:hypothetical protein
MNDTHTDVCGVGVPRPRPALEDTTAPPGFTAALDALQHWLRAEEIPFAVIGSLACAAWTGQESLARFSRPGGLSRARRYPDIDVLVPRAAVAAVARHARGVRSSFPVAVDLSGASCFVDLRPDSDMSYLTHRELRYPVPSWLFTPYATRVAGTGIAAVDPRVLLHTFGAVGGIIRRKDAVKVAALTRALESGAAVSQFTGQDCAVFTTFTAERDRRYPHYRGVVRLVDELLEAAPPGAASSIRAFAMPAAKAVVAAMNRTRTRARA